MYMHVYVIGNLGISLVDENLLTIKEILLLIVYQYMNIFTFVYVIVVPKNCAL